MQVYSARAVLMLVTVFFRKCFALLRQVLTAQIHRRLIAQPPHLAAFFFLGG